jgi:DNA-binding Lrp family transcriptional regulator
MSVQAYILIQTEVGKASSVAASVSAISGVTLAEGVTGPYDVIMRAEAPSMEEFGALFCLRYKVFLELPGLLPVL